jgi:hypothetical protein
MLDSERESAGAIQCADIEQFLRQIINWVVSRDLYGTCDNTPEAKNGNSATLAEKVLTGATKLTGRLGELVV